ncbi:hypothetical protein PUN28_008626 [Cardiocondyla obscurior]|uniref:Secreted protein n=1 Tax=Cardiocondyla obscurior TaxID=286306 RepID=A0AAW2G3K9_9HYME
MSPLHLGPGVSASILLRFLLRYEEVVDVAGLGWSYGGGGAGLCGQDCCCCGCCCCCCGCCCWCCCCC